MNGRLIELAARDEDVLSALRRLQNGTIEDAIANFSEIFSFKDLEQNQVVQRVKLEDWIVAIEIRRSRDYVNSPTTESKHRVHKFPTRRIKNAGCENAWLQPTTCS